MARFLMYEFVKNIEKVSLKEIGTLVGSCMNFKGLKHVFLAACKCKECLDEKAKQDQLAQENEGE